MEAECLERLIDPKLRKAIAAYGWIDEARGLPRKFWVSIESHPTEFFRGEDAAKFYYYHKVSKRNPPVRHGSRKRA